MGFSLLYPFVNRRTARFKVRFSRCRNRTGPAGRPE